MEAGEPDSVRPSAATVSSTTTSSTEVELENDDLPSSAAVLGGGLGL